MIHLRSPEVIQKLSSGAYSVEILESKSEVIPIPIKAEALLSYDNDRSKIIILDGVPHRCHALQRCKYQWLDQSGNHQCDIWVTAGYYCPVHEAQIRARVKAEGDTRRAVDAEATAMAQLESRQRKRYAHLSDEEYNSIFNQELNLDELDFSE